MNIFFGDINTGDHFMQGNSDAGAFYIAVVLQKGVSCLKITKIMIIFRPDYTGSTVHSRFYCGNCIGQLFDYDAEFWAPQPDAIGHLQMKATIEDWP